MICTPNAEQEVPAGAATGAAAGAAAARSTRPLPEHRAVKAMPARLPLLARRCGASSIARPASRPSPAERRMRRVRHGAAAVGPGRDGQFGNGL
eukprot:362713-Chlamydomonas_euryale.AAC.8